MKITCGYDDTIQFSGFGSAHAVSDHVPVKPKKRKFKVGFAMPTKAQVKAVKEGKR